MTTLSIILPVYNEANTVRELLDRVLAVRVPNVQKEILVVESNSTDGTREIIQGYEARGKIRVLYEDQPRGKGLAVRNALPKVTGEIILIQDGDLEYKPEEYPALLKPILDGSADIVLGSRHMGKGGWKIRYYSGSRMYGNVLNLGGWVYTSAFNFFYGLHLTDPATMFKIFRRSLLEGLTFKTRYFDFDWELLGKLVRKSKRIVEIPVEYTSRSTAEGKKIRFFRDGIRVAIAIVRFRFFN